MIDPQRVARRTALSPTEQQAYLDELYRAQIQRFRGRIPQESSALEHLVRAGQITVVGGRYDVRTG